MNIIYINHYAGSLKHGMEYRPYYLSQEWLRAGHHVRIVAASYSHVRSNQPQISGAVTEENIDGIEYIWLRTPNYASNGIRRFANMLTFVKQIYRHSRTILKDFSPDVVIASSTYPLDIFPAQYLARKSRARIIHEVHDLWPLSPIELGGMSPKHPFIRLMQFSEDRAYKVADRVVSLLPLAKDYMVSRGMKPEKFRYIPNGIVLSEWDEMTAPPGKLINDIRTLKANGNFVIAYAGAHGLANSLIHFVYAAQLLQNEKIHFVLIGDGLEKAALIEAASHLQNVSFFPPVPKRAIPSLLQEFDALYIGLKDNPLFRFGISPNKLLDYLAAGRPILKSINSGNDPVQEANAGISVAAEDDEAIANAIRKLATLDARERDHMGENGQNYVRVNHDFSILAKLFFEGMEI